MDWQAELEKECESVPVADESENQPDAVTDAIVDEAVRRLAIKICRAIQALLEGPQDEHFQAVQFLLSAGAHKRRELTEPELVWRRLWSKFGDKETFNPCEPQSTAIKCTKVGRNELLALLQVWEAQGFVEVNKERTAWRLINKAEVK